MQTKVEKDVPSMRVFSNLQGTVSGKAEWIELNSLLRQYNDTVDHLNNHIKQYK